MTLFAQNKKAYHDYEILATFEAGMVLEGAEVKSIRDSKCSIKESYVRIKDGEVWLINSHIAIPSYIPQYARFEETRTRKLLMHKNEILKLKSKLDEKGLTLIATKIYQPDESKKIKIEVALSQGRKNYDKKQHIKEKDIKREMESQIKKFNKVRI